MSVATPMPIMDLTVSAADLQKVFDAYNNFPRGPSKYPVLEMELTKFHKLVRDLDLFGPNLSPVDLDLILLKCRPRGWKKLCLPHFGAAVEVVAKRLGMEASDIINKVIEQGGPVPSAPMPAEWKRISPHIAHSPNLDGSCCERHLAESQRSKREGLGSGAQEKRLLSLSSEWTQLREEREAVRKRFGAKEFAARPRGPGTRTTSMTAAFGSSCSRLGQPLYLTQSEMKPSSGRVSRTAGRAAPHSAGPSSRTQSFQSGPESRTPLGPHAILRSSSSSDVDSPITPFVITDTGSSSSSSSISYQVVVTSSSYKTPRKALSDTAEKITDLQSAFAFFCTLSQFKEHEPSLLKLPPQMNQAEFRRLCRECDLLQGGGSELPDVTFHITTTRSKTKFMDFPAFLFALERIALSMHLSFADMEGRITSAAERLQESGVE